jgi:hypothetical protein
LLIVVDGIVVGLAEDGMEVGLGGGVGWEMEGDGTVFVGLALTVSKRGTRSTAGMISMLCCCIVCFVVTKTLVVFLSLPRLFTLQIIKHVTTMM